MEKENCIQTATITVQLKDWPCVIPWQWWWGWAKFQTQKTILRCAFFIIGYAFPVTMNNGVHGSLVKISTIRGQVIKGPHFTAIELGAQLFDQKQMISVENSHNISKKRSITGVSHFWKGLFVTYWPSTEQSIKRCTCVNNRCIWSRMAEYHLDLWTWLNSVQMRTTTGSRSTSNSYITRCQRRLESVAVSCTVGGRVAVPFGDKISEWDPAPDRGVGPSGTWLSSPAESGRSAAEIRETWGLSPSATHLSHITNISPFAILSQLFQE